LVILEICVLIGLPLSAANMIAVIFFSEWAPPSDLPRDCRALG
jgi:hypothetical protein